MDTTSTQAAFLLTSAFGTAVTGSFSWDPIQKTMTFTPTLPLSSGISYTAKVAKTAKSLKGFTIADDYSWSFTTA
jgi:hypothetical protein